MVDLTSDHWTRDAQKRVAAPIRPWIVGLVVVGLTAAMVMCLQGLVVWDQGSVQMLWIAFAGLVAIAILRRTLSSGARHSSPDAAPQSGREHTRPHHDARRHRRFVPARRATVLHMRDGRQIPARIVDISIAGVAVEARLTDVEFLSVTRVGSRIAGPVRQTRSGAVFGFDTLLEPQPFDASFVL